MTSRYALMESVGWGGVERGEWEGMRAHPDDRTADRDFFFVHL